MGDTPPIVTEADERPNGKGSGHCFYCPSRIGERHAAECVIWTRPVVVRMAVEYTIEVPHSWTAHNIEFHRNEGTWCADNALDELQKLSNEESRSCLCPMTTFTYVGEAELDKPPTTDV